MNKIIMVNNAMRAFSADGAWTVNATAVRGPGDALSWISSSRYGAPQEQHAVYSVITPQPGSLALPILSANGRTDLWSLCPDKNPSRPQTRLVYNVAGVERPPPSWLTFDPANCYPVTVNVVPA